MTLPQDYLEKVYAGVLGKVIGVYLGRPFEGWTYERIMAELGEVWYYVHERLGKPLIVTDDDITGTFTFIRALADHPGGYGLSSAQIGQTWLNYIIENRSILWWGGLGNSTEHTAFLRLKQGIPAPQSGSIALNGKVVAEQIGAQIFIDGWGMVCPGDPEKAAALAAQAGRVSHDGEAIYAAQVIAAMEAEAFTHPGLDHLLDTALGLIPADSTIARLIGDLREWRAQTSDWREARARVAARYGYDKYPGNCHVVPNHALVQLGLLYGDDNFQRALMVTNTSGWDTDCNSANVGCIMGLRLGLAGIEAGPDWRGPLADRIYLPTADGGSSISDCAQQALSIANLGRGLAGLPALQPKGGARFHFDLPGALQGFTAESGPGLAPLVLENVPGHSAAGARSLALRYRGLAPGLCARASSLTFIPLEAAAMPGYALDACPTLYPGQTLRARLSAAAANRGRLQVCLFAAAYDRADRLSPRRGPAAELAPGAALELAWTLEDESFAPLARVGLEITADGFAEGEIYLDWLGWDGAPALALAYPAGSGKMVTNAWIHALDLARAYANGWLACIQNHGRGLLIQGTREWHDYRIGALLKPHLMRAGGLAVRVQGLRRYYALLLCEPGLIQLVRVYDGAESVLDSAAFDWHIEQEYALQLQAHGAHLQAWLDGRLLFSVEDGGPVLLDGAAALVIEEGYYAAREVEIRPATSSSDVFSGGETA